MSAILSATYPHPPKVVLCNDSQIFFSKIQTTTETKNNISNSHSIANSLLLNIKSHPHGMAPEKQKEQKNTTTSGTLPKYDDWDDEEIYEDSDEEMKKEQDIKSIKKNSSSSKKPKTTLLQKARKPLIQTPSSAEFCSRSRNIFINYTASNTKKDARSCAVKLTESEEEDEEYEEEEEDDCVVDDSDPVEKYDSDEEPENHYHLCDKILSKSGIDNDTTFCDGSSDDSSGEDSDSDSCEWDSEENMDNSEDESAAEDDILRLPTRREQRSSSRDFQKKPVKKGDNFKCLLDEKIAEENAKIAISDRNLHRRRAKSAKAELELLRLTEETSKKQITSISLSDMADEMCNLARSCLVGTNSERTKALQLYHDTCAQWKTSNKITVYKCTDKRMYAILAWMKFRAYAFGNVQMRSVTEKSDEFMEALRYSKGFTLDTKSIVDGTCTFTEEKQVPCHEICLLGSKEKTSFLFRKGPTFDTIYSLLYVWNMFEFALNNMRTAVKTEKSEAITRSLFKKALNITYNVFADGDTENLTA